MKRYEKAEQFSVLVRLINMMITKPTLEDLIVRPAEDTDLWDLAELHRTCWQVGFGAILSPEYLSGLTSEKEIELWERRLASKTFRRNLHVADYHGFTVGYFSAKPNARAGEGVGHEEWMEVSEFYVSPSVWRQGVGTRMMDILFDMVMASGFDRACLWALRDAASSRGFYESTGWTHDKRIRGKTKVGEQDVELVRYTIHL